MRAFDRLTGIAVPLARDNVDTDAIFPASALERAGRNLERIGECLFLDWRYDPAGRPRPDFALNQHRYAGAQVLVTGANFGCGSSREHAVWALAGYGLRVVIASSFGDIFRDNCIRNGLLPAQVAAPDLAKLHALLAARSDPVALRIDLTAQTLAADGIETFRFEVDPMGREMLLEGIDPVSLTLRHLGEIEAFEQARQAARPWFTALASVPLAAPSLTPQEKK